MTGRPQFELAVVLGEAMRPVVAELVEQEVARQLDELDLRANGPRWLTLEQAAARLGCTPNAVRMRARRGRLDYRKQGSRFYVSAETVDELGRTLR